MQYAVTAALTGDKSHQLQFRADLKARATLTVNALNAMPALSCTPVSAGFYAMPCITLPPGRTDEEYVLGLLRETGVLVVYGSGFGLPTTAGYLRIVFLASPDELTEVPAHGCLHRGLPAVSTGSIVRVVVTTALTIAVLAGLHHRARRAPHHLHRRSAGGRPGSRRPLNRARSGRGRAACALVGSRSPSICPSSRLSPSPSCSSSAAHRSGAGTVAASARVDRARTAVPGKPPSARPPHHPGRGRQKRTGSWPRREHRGRRGELGLWRTHHARHAADLTFYLLVESSSIFEGFGVSSATPIARASQRGAQDLDQG